MALPLPKTCAMGSSQTALVGTIGITLLNPGGTVHTARATAGIYEIGGGCYGKNISFPDNWAGVLKWDTGGGSPVYAVEEYTVDGLADTILEDTDGAYTGTPPTVDQIATAIFDKAVEGTLTFVQLQRIIKAFAGGKTSGGGTVGIKFRDTADSKDRIAMTVDDNGNRSAVTLDGT